MSTNTTHADAKTVDALTAIAKGQRVHHNTLKNLVRRGLVDKIGRLTDAGREAAGINKTIQSEIAAEMDAERERLQAERIAGVAPTKKKPAKECADCGVALNGRTRSDHPLFCTYCEQAGGWENEHVDGLAEVGDHDGCVECGTYDPAAHWATKPVKPKRSRKMRPCTCGCGGMTSGGKFLPGHDARWAGETGRQAAQTLSLKATQAEAARAVADLVDSHVEVSDALLAKAARIAVATRAKIGVPKPAKA